MFAITITDTRNATEGSEKMPRVVPSQVRGLIEQMFGTQPSANPNFAMLSISFSSQLTVLSKMVGEIPDDLLILKGEDYSKYLWALETMRHQLTVWLQEGKHLTYLSPVGGQSPVVLIYDLLGRCPDEAVSPTTATLAFVRDVALRESIRLDISAASRDLSNGEWKGATVLAGSATEALLLWAIQEAEKKNAGAIDGARRRLISANKLPSATTPDYERWGLNELGEVAFDMKLIFGTTAQQVQLCRSFRNLIHPGRATRLQQTCDKGTAFAALASTEFVAADLAKTLP